MWTYKHNCNCGSKSTIIIISIYFFITATYLKCGTLQWGINRWSLKIETNLKINSWRRLQHRDFNVWYDFYRHNTVINCGFNNWNSSHALQRGTETETWHFVPNFSNHPLRRHFKWRFMKAFFKEDPYRGR